MSTIYRVQRRLAGERGVTLVELMVTLMVVGILLAIAAPSIHNHIALAEIRASAREVVEVMRDARDSAMNEGLPRYVLFIPGEPARYEVRRFAGGAWTLEQTAVPLGGSVRFTDADVTFPRLDDTPASPAFVPENAAYFDTRGRYPYVSGGAASYTLTLRGGVGRTVVLTLHTSTGQVTGI